MSPAGTMPRDFSYINSRKRKPSEYEAVNLHVQPRLGDVWDKCNSYLRTPQGRPAFIEESTALRHPDWHDFRDPCGLWQRPYMRMQAEQERAIERLTVDVSPTLARDVDPQWRDTVLVGHYAVWSFVEWGLFRGMFSASREGLSDTVVASMLFETFDRARHSQDIVHWLLALEENTGVDGTGAKDAWLNEPRYQPMREMVERIAWDTPDWCEVIVATNLCFDPIVSDLAVHRLIGRYAPRHGDVVSKLIVASVERDRKRDADWTAELVRMTTGDDVPEAAANRLYLGEWVAKWTPLAQAAAQGLRSLYDELPGVGESFDDAYAEVVEGQRALIEGLKLGGSP
ncbi:MAG: hypothetical protein ACT4QF_07465 [Sporichthyaceae bacterium]